jgi:hypothetical protein
MQIGGSYYHDEVSNSETAFCPRYGQTILNGHVVYVAHGTEILNAGVLIRYAQLHTPVVFDTPAFYSQISQRFGRIRPFFRYQYINGGATNPIHEDVGSWLLRSDVRAEHEDQIHPVLLLTALATLALIPRAATKARM